MVVPYSRRSDLKAPPVRWNILSPKKRRNLLPDCRTLLHQEWATLRHVVKTGHTFDLRWHLDADGNMKYWYSSNALPIERDKHVGSSFHN